MLKKSKCIDTRQALIEMRFSCNRKFVSRVRVLPLVPGITMLCALAACSSNVDLVADETAELQRNTLSHVYYNANPYPSEPDAAEIRHAIVRVNNAREWERQLLTELFPGDEASQALAIRDLDGDGIKDYRVSDYYGRFLEGDTDVDGDGVNNVLDSEPDDASVAHPQGVELPPHVAWRGRGKPHEMVLMQETLFRDHGIVLVERSADFTPELARSVFDTVTRVYSGVFSEHGILPTLRVIATERSSLLYADADEGAGDFAQVFAATRTMEIYQLGIESPPIIQLGFLAHEIAHMVQFAMDYDEAKQDAIARENRFNPERFHALVADYGWTVVPYDVDPESVYRLFRPQYISIEPWSYLYFDESPEEWQAWLTAISNEVGAPDYLADGRVTANYIPGDYSMTNPWEWYSDHVIAYVYLAMFRALADDCDPASVDALAADMQERVVAEWWPAFRFENARGAAIQEHLAAAFPIHPDDLDYLAATYLPPGACSP
jgi:hypothetical protein